MRARTRNKARALRLSDVILIIGAPRRHYQNSRQENPAIVEALYCTLILWSYMAVNKAPSTSVRIRIPAKQREYKVPVRVAKSMHIGTR